MASQVVISDVETVKEVVTDSLGLGSMSLKDDVPTASKMSEISCSSLVNGLVRNYPENFDQVRYLKLLKDGVASTETGKEEIKNLILPFHKSLPVFNKKMILESDGKPVPHVHLEAEGRRDVEFKTLEMKVMATVSAVMVDKKCPKSEHLAFLRSLNELIVELLSFFGTKRAGMKRLLKLAAAAVDHLFNSNLIKDPVKEEYQLGLQDTGVEYMLNHLVDFIVRDFKGACDQAFKSDIVETVIGLLKPTPMRRRLFELFTTGIKTCLGHIHRGDRNTQNHGVLPMMYVETVFCYLHILETIVAVLPYIQESELGTLECIERTVAGSLKYSLIENYIARIATLASNLPRIPPPFVRRSTGISTVPPKIKKPVKAVTVPKPNVKDGKEKSTS